MTRVAVLADTHLPRRTRTLPDRLLQECAQADLILHAGDLVQAGVLAELEAYAPVQAVLGNCDEVELAGLLPESRIVPVEGVRIGMIHDSGPAAGRGARLAARFRGCRVAVFGHSHQPVLERHGDLLLLNPGSAIERRRAPVCTMAVLEVAGEQVEARLVELPDAT